jgi:hypothetical protein
MNRFVTFGCSFTEGFKLVDKQTTWPYMLGKQFNVDVDNRGKIGSSNLQILADVLSYQFISGDVVVILWSWFARDTLMNNKNKGLWQNIHVGDNADAVVQWAKYHNDIDMLTRSWLYIHHVEQHLTNKGITLYNFTTNEDLFLFKPAFIPTMVEYPNVKEITSIYGTVDGMHPNDASHKQIAIQLSKTILKDTV